ncbi:PREDICTED: dnaJ homolog subfamily C member 11 [Papilio xuthus]|uniref:DnaJ homolog subfamily C member 11 n=1 Tax=Papilio xuthus TaxID=66420 RepID=A0A194PSD0_PAPXU|nr:PREDICTED: dnaJ homolog subfamily C member 11 [Papilio xuthus]KPI96217.1 DnaJ-like subfamily C member 11 [Papilio xuthus]
MDEEGESILLEDNYYQLLNVSKTASTEEINSAYRRFSRMFHPDKHSTDSKKQKWAEQIFNKVKEAYEVLSDSHKRAIYDTLGKRGLEVDGWEIIFRTRTPKEIRDEYERLKREREERRLQQTANPRGTITLSINATDMFTKYYDQYEILDDTALIPNIEVSGMTIQQSIDAPVTLRNTMTLSGNISTQNGNGTGSVNVSNRHLSSEKGWTEVECGIGNGPLLGFKVFRTLSRVMFLNCGTVLQFTPRGIVPSFVSTMALQLDAHSVGYLTYRAGGQSGSSMTSMYVRDSEKYHTNTALQIGNPHSFISFNVMRKLPQYDMKLRLALKFGTFGAIAEYGAEKKVSQNSSVSAAVMVGVPTGVVLKLKWSCSSQTIVVPMHLCDEVMPSPVFYATVVPLVSWLVLKKMVLDPIAKERQERERQRSMEANFERLQEMQQQARATVELMRETYSRIRNDEEKKKGLVILQALYGKLPAGADSHDVAPDEAGDGVQPESPHGYSEVIEVTIPLQCLVKDSRLELLEASKSELPGFYDPCVGDDKHLTVKYSYHNNLYICTITDQQAVVLPRNSHRIKNRS